jgi:hypothetical protein
MLPGGQTETRDAGDTWQCFSTESESVDGSEIFARADFAGGMPFEAEQGIVTVHSTAIVDHANGGDAPAANEHFDLVRPGVDGILDQFLDHTGRALNDLASGDLAGDLFGKEGNAGHVEGFSIAGFSIGRATSNFGRTASQSLRI